MAKIIDKNTGIGKSLSLRDYSEPIASQQTTSYAFNGYSGINFDPVLTTTDLIKYESELINIWRQMAKNSFVRFAIDDIINEMLAIDAEEVYPIRLNLDNTEFSEDIRKKIHTEFITIMKLLQFSKKSYTILTDWYIDGKSYFFIDTDGKQINDIVPLDPQRTKRVVKDDKKNGVKEVKYVYQDIDLTSCLYEFDESHFVEVSSGVMDDKHQIWVSPLYEAYVALNQLSSIEDAIVIYRITRAPERRVFYIDVGELPKTKAEAYMKDLIRNCRNKMEYDSETGKISEKTRHSSMIDDIWLPRSNSRGTEVSTLPAGQNLSNIEDLEYFLQKLFRSLKVPMTRFSGADGPANVIGRTSEISRDEVKYGSFIARLRQQFNSLFYQLLRMSCIMKNIATSEEMNAEHENIVFKWNTDSMFSEFRKIDLLTERLNLLERLENQIGKTVSLHWVRTNVLKQTDEEIEDMDKEMTDEKAKLKSLGLGPQVDDEGSNE